MIAALANAFCKQTNKSVSNAYYITTLKKVHYRLLIRILAYDLKQLINKIP